MNNSACVLLCLLVADYKYPPQRLLSLPGGEKRVIIKNTDVSVGTNRLYGPRSRSPSVSVFLHQIQVLINTAATSRWAFEENCSRRLSALAPNVVSEVKHLL